MNIYVLGSSHCRNIFSNENFGCINGVHNKSEIIRKWSSKGLHIKEAERNVDGYSMSKFVTNQRGGIEFCENEIRCYVFGEIDIRVD